MHIYTEFIPKAEKKKCYLLASKNQKTIITQGDSNKGDWVWLEMDEHP